MSTKAEIVTWAKGIKLYNEGKNEDALGIFEQMASSSKIYFNIGCLFHRLDMLDQTIDALTKSLEYDQFFALAYFMRATCLYKLGILEDALSDLNDSIKYFRGNLYINYLQLGLDYKFYVCIAYFNRGLCFSRLNIPEEAGKSFNKAAMAAESCEDLDLRPITQAVRLQNGTEHNTLRIYEFPHDILFTPPVEKLVNLDKKEYLPKAELITSSNAENNYTGFSGRGLSMEPRSKQKDKILEEKFKFAGKGNIPDEDGKYGDLNTNSKSTAGGEPGRKYAPVSAYSSKDISTREKQQYNINPESRGSEIAEKGGMKNSAMNAPFQQQQNKYQSDNLGVGSDPRYNSNVDKKGMGQDTNESALDDLLNEIVDDNKKEKPLATENTKSSYSLQKHYADLSNTDGSRSTIDQPPPLTVLKRSNKVRVKIKRNNETHAFAISPDVTLDEFRERTRKKLGVDSDTFSIFYKDEDGDMIKVADDEDVTLALQSSISSKQGCGRLDIWYKD